MTKKFKIGIVLDGCDLPDWKNTLLKKIAAETNIEVSALLLPKEGNQPIKKKSGFWKFHMQLDKNYFNPEPDAFKSVKLSSNFKEIPEIDQNDLKTIGQFNLDIILWLSDRAINEKIYGLLSIGLLYFSHGEGRRTPEFFLGYREFTKKQGVVTSSLMIQNTPTDPAMIVYQTWSMTNELSISRARNEHMWKLASLVPRVLKEICTLDQAVFFNKIRADKMYGIALGAKNNDLPSTFESMVNLAQYAGYIMIRMLRKLISREQWILLLNTNKGASTTFTDFKKILPPKDCFWADPFLVENEGKQYLFIEELPFATYKGHLSVMEIDEYGTVSQPVKILDKPYHLSYPFIFETAGTYYMIPESYEDKSVQLYECLEFPLQWKHKMNLMTNVDAFDTTLYFYNEKWWLFTVISEQKGSGHNDELFLFFADTPFTTEWKSHPQNPIVSDARLARPAGNIYEENGKLIRPSQGLR